MPVLELHTVPALSRFRAFYKASLMQILQKIEFNCHSFNGGIFFPITRYVSILYGCSSEFLTRTVSKVFILQAVLSSGVASSKHCEGDGPLTYALKRKMCLENKKIIKPIIENYSGRRWRRAIILSLVATGLFIFMLVICYLVRRKKPPTPAKLPPPPSSSKPPTATGLRSAVTVTTHNIQGKAKVIKITYT